MSLKLDLVGVVAKDVLKSVEFYRMLGLEFPEVKPDEDHVEATLPNGLRFSIDALSLMKEIDPNWVEPVGKRMGIAFLCDSPAEVDATYHAIKDAGYHGVKEPWDAFWGQRYAMVEDPDGNGIDLFAWQ